MLNCYTKLVFRVEEFTLMDGCTPHLVEEYSNTPPLTGMLCSTCLYNPELVGSLFEYPYILQAAMGYFEEPWFKLWEFLSVLIVLTVCFSPGQGVG